MCKSELCALQFSTAPSNSGTLKKSPSSIDFVILVNSWYTILPAPMFVCPTSEFPICPSGRPTFNPLVYMSVVGHSFIILSMFGVLANLTAFPFSFVFSPNPSLALLVCFP